MKQNLITVFTPAYNRAALLPRLYDSLLRQRYGYFEWVIVDDGSTDDTQEAVNNIICQQKIRVLYHRQKNTGKHTAINQGLDLASGELFFIVDSDDWLYDDALEKINHLYESVKNDRDFCGVSGVRTYPHGRRIGGEDHFGVIDCTVTDLRYRHRIRGDMAEAFRTEILRQYRFPEVAGERFCPEALVWNRMAQQYKLRYSYEKIYYCEYLPDGLTSRITQLRKENPVSTCMHYAELRQMDISFVQKIKAAINYWRFAFYLNGHFKDKIRQAGVVNLCVFPLGYMLYLMDKRR